ncbi:MAG: hypothetical protein FWC79_02545 [Oscillospiraceae bacterium]|nr:hypothetical protein [Oscillospiraceae bacterium]
MTRRLVLLISVVLAFLFITNVSFAATKPNTANRMSRGIQNAAERITDDVEDAGSAVGGAVRGSMNRVRNTVDDGVRTRDARAPHVTRDGVNHTTTRTATTNNARYQATRTNAPFSTAPTTGQIITWTVLGIVGLIIISAIWYYAARTTRNPGRD